jgi:hypothetical protein
MLCFKLKVDANGSRFLMGDIAGHLFMLLLEKVGFFLLENSLPVQA